MKLFGRKPKEKIPKVEPKGVADRLVMVLATGFGFGYAPVAPGTVGALWGLGLFLLLAWLGIGILVYAAVMVLLVVIAIPVCGRAERLFGERDSNRIVLDEIVSVPITFFPAYPFVVTFPVFYLILAGFLLNRFFDIVKLYPAGKSQRLPGGWGVVIDDVIAGVQSNIVMQGLALALLAFAQ
jgi:phosphatidylglycerophosphatase A